MTLLCEQAIQQFVCLFFNHLILVLYARRADQMQYKTQFGSAYLFIEQMAQKRKKKFKPFVVMMDFAAKNFNTFARVLDGVKFILYKKTMYDWVVGKITSFEYSILLGCYFHCKGACGKKILYNLNKHLINKLTNEKLLHLKLFLMKQIDYIYKCDNWLNIEKYIQLCIFLLTIIELQYIIYYK